MGFTFRCEKCGKEFESAETLTEKSIHCPECRQPAEAAAPGPGLPLADQTIIFTLDQVQGQKGKQEEQGPAEPQNVSSQTINAPLSEVRKGMGGDEEKEGPQPIPQGTITAPMPQLQRQDEAQQNDKDAGVDLPEGTRVVPMNQLGMEIETDEGQGDEAPLGETMAATPEDLSRGKQPPPNIPQETMAAVPQDMPSEEEHDALGLKEIRVGIIGAGWMGQNHAKALADIHGARLVAVADTFRETAEQVGDEFDVDFHVDPKELAQRDDVDCVIIATNDEAHVEPVAAAAAAGKHILLEKPIATTLTDADQIIRLCERANVKLMLGFILRFDKRYARVKEAVANGEIGELESIFCRRTNLVTSQERLKGRVSVLSFLGVHDFDMMRWVAGSEVKRVHTEAVWNLHRKHGFDVEDTTWTLLRFENGVIGSLETGWVVPTTHPTKADFKLEVTGTKGMITYDLTRQELMFTTPDGHYSERFNPMLQYQLEHFLDCVRNDTEPLVTGIDGRAALEISLAAQQSAKSEQIVPLPLT